MKSLMLIVEARAAVASIRTASGSAGAPVPPWLLFSGRWPWVTTPCQSTGSANGSLPVTDGSSEYQIGSMIPMTSYHEEREVSYVAETLSRSPFLTATRQSGLVNVIATSHETAPAGSKYLASERKISLVWPARVCLRSTYRPPGCRCPPAATSVASVGTVISLASPL